MAIEEQQINLLSDVKGLAEAQLCHVEELSGNRAKFVLHESGL